jgi:hypothetical protein
LTDGVASHWERSIHRSAVRVTSASNTATILHAILTSRAIVVGSTSRIANIGGTNLLGTQISIPVVTSIAIGVVSAVQAKSVGHAVSSLSASTTSVI